MGGNPKQAANSMRIVYQFPISHYCEKTRWHLDHKHLDYQVENLFPGLHRFKARRLAGITTLPILKDGDTVIGDSTAIAVYLEKTYPSAPLLPEDAQQREDILALEERFDRLGVHVRRWIYGHLSSWDSALDGMLGSFRPLFGLRDLSRPLLIKALHRLYGLTPDRIEKSAEQVAYGLALIEERLGNDPQRYLVGDRLSLADIAAAALYAPLFAPAGTPWHGMVGHDAASQAQIAEWRLRPAGQWVLRLYAQARHD